MKSYSHARSNDPYVHICSLPSGSICLLLLLLHTGRVAVRPRTLTLITLTLTGRVAVRPPGHRQDPLS